MDFKDYNAIDDVFWANTTNDIAIDMTSVKQRTAKAIALNATTVVYVSNGTDWINMTTSTAIPYYVLTLTIGAHTRVSVIDSLGNVYTNGSRVYVGATLTITATADAGYTLTTYTVNEVDKTASNPTTHTMSLATTVVTAATAE